jgi:hypothetical protein
MRYLALSLFAEGQTDQEFLPRLIFRSVTELSASISNQQVEIPEQFIRSRPTSKNLSGLSRPERVEALFGAALESLDLLFIHADGGSDPEAARTARVEPCCERLRVSFPNLRFRCVGLVPVYETEAWALADSDAILRALGTTKSAQELGLPISPQNAESRGDPKEILRKVQTAVQGARQRGRLRNPPILSILGETVSLTKLRQMNAFQAFETSVRQALLALWGMQA